MNDQATGSVTSLMLFVATVVLAAICVVRGLILLIRQPHTLARITLGLVSIAAPACAWFFATTHTIPAAPVFLRGFARWTARNADIAVIQQWLSTDGPAFADEHADQSYRYDFPAEYPECLVELEPKYIRFERTAEGDLTVQLEWGGGMSIWGIVVGPPTMKTPETGAIELGFGETEFRRPVGPGAYVFSRG
jgi:hypothetical protein